MSKVQFVSSELLLKTGIRHGWFMRYGGVSEGLFESLNGKKGIGDGDENVDENRRRALAALCHPELDSGSSCNKDYCLRRNDSIAHIVHEFKSNILDANQSGVFEFFDASITDNKDIVLSQTTADCASIIISDLKGRCVALVHGSWHTLKAKIICDVVAKLKQDFKATDLVAGIGPMICKKCYEFGPEAKELFDYKYLQPNTERYLVDLKQMVKDQLVDSGVREIDDLSICTLEDERFFSHRRSGAHSGRMITLASLRSS